MKLYKFVAILLIMMLFLAGGWIVYRLTVSKVCDQQSIERSVYDASPNSFPDLYARTTQQTMLHAKYYDLCIGLN
jgi:hypothetical protein